MRNRVSQFLSMALLAATCGIMPVSGQSQTEPAAPAATATEDVVYMRDGRELHGQIVSETKSLIIFEFMDPALKVKTKLTLLKENVIQIDRKVAVAAQPAKDVDKPVASTPIAKPQAQSERTFGASRADASVVSVPSFYVVPMSGQMGTDVHSDIYKQIIANVKEVKPDIVIIKMFCQDTEDRLYSEKNEEIEKGLLEWDEYRTLISVFRNDLREFRQVCWVEDSVGISSMVAMAWPEIYMKPTARFGGLSVAHTEMFYIPDLDVRGKMVAALMGIVKSFLEYGGYSLVLADAMVRPDATLSATWKGREVDWSLDDSGEYLVDGNDKRTTEFRAKAAEDFCISKGTAETLDDLALLLGYREYRVVESKAEQLCADYVQNWRRAYDEAKKLYDEYQQFMGWATGQDEVKYLGRAKSALERIVAYMERYKAVEVRLSQEMGIDKQQLIVLTEQIKERLRAIKSSPNPTGGGTGINRNRGGGSAAN